MAGWPGENMWYTHYLLSKPQPQFLPNQFINPLLKVSLRYPFSPAQIPQIKGALADTIIFFLVQPDARAFPITNRAFKKLVGTVNGGSA